MKLVLAIVMVIGSLTFANAEVKSKYYIGLGISIGSGKVTKKLIGNDETVKHTWKENGNSEISYDYNSFAVPIKVGYIFDSLNRFEFEYKNSEKYKFKDKTMRVRSYNFNWLFVYLEKEKFHPYWMIGLSKYTWKDGVNSLQDKKDLEGLGFRLGAGILYDITANIEAELSYKYNSITWQTVRYSSLDVDMETNSSGYDVTAGLNYKF
jgi:opacity protein-like surface antigen